MEKNGGKISFLAGVLISINVIVGAGIYLGPSKMAAQVGNVSFLAWGVVALIMLPIVWNIAQATRLFPGQGGLYNYCTTGLNQTAGFFALWSYFLGFCAAGATLVSTLAVLITKKLMLFGAFSDAAFWTTRLILVVLIMLVISC